MNVQQQWDEFCETIDAVMAETGIRSRMDAADEVRRRYPHLRDAKYPGAPGMTTIASSAGSRSTATPMVGGSAEAQLNALARKIAAERRVTYAQAYVEALNSDPHLYVAYLQEQEAKLAAGVRRG